MGWLLLIGYLIMWFFTAVIVAGLMYRSDPYRDGALMVLGALMGFIAGMLWPIALIIVLIMKVAYRPVKR